MQADDEPFSAPDDEDTDNCLCGLEHLEDEAISDEELPPASGGIETSEQEQSDDETDLDGCELDFTLADPTGDDELPAAVGGT